MKRRDFFRSGAAAALGTAIIGPLSASTQDDLERRKRTQAKNIIFLVSDGMSTGTLNMADLLLQRKEGKGSAWMKLYRESQGVRALMDTASASSLVTDSAAGSSSWGGGVRVPNGSLNVGANGEMYRPILQKFKEAGKSVGCVTTVPITHATPAGFCINNKSRGGMEDIALQYLPLRLDVMMGGGLEVIHKDARKDKRDLLKEFTDAGYQVTGNKADFSSLTSDKPVLGVFHQNGLPFTVDYNSNNEIQKKVPTLAEMTEKAISLMKNNPRGFVMQVEAGKVDWAAHANDVAGLIYDQIAFDEAVEVALKFARQDKETLVIITTDHGNANPGLFYGNDADRNFESLFTFKHSNEWILNGITHEFTPVQVVERVVEACGFAITGDEAKELLQSYTAPSETGVYNPRKLPFERLAQMLRARTSVGWASMEHSGDFVELAAFGPGSELIKPFVVNTDLHKVMLTATGVKG